VITIGGYYDKNANIEAEVSELVEKQLAGMKFKVGGLTPREDAERVKRARRAAGDNFALAVDANQGWSPSEAIEFARRVQDCNLLWFEEPCQWHNDRRAMRDVRLSAGIPVCAGQSDYCNFDSSWSGGPTEWRRVAGIAAAYDIKMAHHEEPHIAGHLLASVPHGTFLELFSPQRDPIWHNLIANRPKLEHGFMALPSTPGLGWELDADYIRKYEVGGL
jgi:L-alanine-DL-glutamate epimerase-like enolase superfamily enzyme